jgi:hypothetical protein
MADDDSAPPLAERWLTAKQRLKALFADIVKEIGEDNAVRL